MFLSCGDIYPESQPVKISDDELLSIIDDATLALGQILLRHRELSENLLDTQQTQRGMEKIDSLRKKL